MKLKNSMKNRSIIHNKILSLISKKERVTPRVTKRKIIFKIAKDKTNTFNNQSIKCQLPRQSLIKTLNRIMGGREVKSLAPKLIRITKSSRS